MNPPRRLTALSAKQAGTFLWPMRCQRPHILNMRRPARSSIYAAAAAGAGSTSPCRSRGAVASLHLYTSPDIIRSLAPWASYLPGSLTTFEAHFGACSPLTVHPLSSIVFGEILPNTEGRRQHTCLSGANVTLTDRLRGCPHVEGRGPVWTHFEWRAGSCSCRRLKSHPTGMESGSS